MSDKPRRPRRNLRYSLYRLQQRLALTSQEAKALGTVLALLFLGIIVSQVQKHRPAFQESIYAETDSLFLQATAARKAKTLGTASGDSAGDSTANPSHDSLLAFFKPRFPVNINTSDQAQLELLPRIGPSMAQRIIAYREENGPFKRKADLMRVKGIGEKTLEQLEDKISVE